MRPFTNLKVWQAAHALTLRVYALSRGFPPEERYGLTSQLRRACSAVAANIAEGSKARHAADFARILNVAEKEAAETEYHLLLARDLSYLTGNVADELLSRCDEVGRMLSGLRSSVERQAKQQPVERRKPTHSS